MEVTTRTGKEATSTAKVLQKKPAGALKVNYRDLVGAEGITLGFRADMFTVGKGKESGRVQTGTGLGTDFIIMEWKGKSVFVRATDLFREWVKTFDPKAAKEMSW